MGKMRHVDLRRLTIADAEARVLALITERQEDLLADYEITLVDRGVTADDLRRELACRRAELETVREKLLDRLRRLR
jgi:hypothetical protein